jgi:hypothetical protein
MNAAYGPRIRALGAAAGAAAGVLAFGAGAVGLVAEAAGRLRSGGAGGRRVLQQC